MPEIVGNLHLHTTASDGMGTHDQVARAAIKAGLDFIIYTDHNVWVDGIEGWYRPAGADRDLLRLMGQEVNDEEREPELNHLLTYFVTRDLRSVSAEPQRLIDTINAAGGVSFLAHPLERPGLPAAQQTYNWVNWEVSGFTGIELWNAMTDAKWQLRTLPRAIAGAYFPPLALSAPFEETLAKWDELLTNGHKVVAIGGSDAHGWSFTLGPLRRTVYPYEFLFRAVNTHLLLEEPPSREVDQARQQIRDALQKGRCFVSYDLVAPSRGFTFTATNGHDRAGMGDTIRLRSPVALSVSSPARAELRLLHNGRVLAAVSDRRLEWQATEPGFYRVEAYRRFWGRRRGWVFTNPIYVETEG